MTTLAERIAELTEGWPRGWQARLARACKIRPPSVSDWVSGESKSIDGDNLIAAARFFQVEPEWLQKGIGPKHRIPQTQAPSPATDGIEAEPGDLVIHHFATGGGMDNHGRLLLEDQPGVIRSWHVSPEWLRLNVPSHTGVKNLAIVTGFGPSMKPMFNPGDPLLVDTGVKVIDHEGVYFFRVGDEGYIKLVQRVPSFDGAGFVLRIISKNPDYPPYDLSPKNPHLEVLGKVLTVWRSEHF